MDPSQILSYEIGHDSKSVLSTEEPEGTPSESTRVKGSPRHSGPHLPSGSGTASEEHTPATRPRNIERSRSVPRLPRNLNVAKEAVDLSDAVTGSPSEGTPAGETSSTDTSTGGTEDHHHHHEKKADKKMGREAMRRQLTLTDSGSEEQVMQNYPATRTRSSRPVLPDIFTQPVEDKDSETDFDKERNAEYDSLRTLGQQLKQSGNKSRRILKYNKSSDDRDGSESPVPTKPPKKSKHKLIESLPSNLSTDELIAKSRSPRVKQDKNASSKVELVKNTGTEATVEPSTVPVSSVASEGKETQEKPQEDQKVPQEQPQEGVSQTQQDQTPEQATKQEQTQVATTSTETTDKEPKSTVQPQDETKTTETTEETKESSEVDSKQEQKQEQTQYDTTSTETTDKDSKSTEQPQEMTTSFDSTEQSKASICAILPNVLTASSRNRRVANRAKPKKECHLSLYSKDSFRVCYFVFSSPLTLTVATSYDNQQSPACVLIYRIRSAATTEIYGVRADPQLLILIYDSPRSKFILFRVLEISVAAISHTPVMVSFSLHNFKERIKISEDFNITWNSQHLPLAVGSFSWTF